MSTRVNTSGTREAGPRASAGGADPSGARAGQSESGTSSPDAIHLGSAALAKIVGGIMFERGSGESAGPATGVTNDQSTRLSDGLSPLERMVLGFRALVGEFGKCKQSDIVRDAATLRMTDAALSSRFRKALEASFGGDTEEAKRIYQDVSARIEAGGQAARYSSREAANVRRALRAVLNVSGRSAEDYVGRHVRTGPASGGGLVSGVTDLYHGATDRQFAKVRTDAAHRFFGAVQRAAVSTLSRSVAVAGAGVHPAAVAVGFIEGALHQMIDTSVRVKSGRAHVGAAGASLADQLGHLFETERSDTPYAAVRAGRHSLVAEYFRAKKAYERVVASEKAAEKLGKGSGVPAAFREGDTAAREDFQASYSRLSREIAALDRQAVTGGKISFASLETYKAFERVRAIVERDGEVHGLTAGPGNTATSSVEAVRRMNHDRITLEGLWKKDEIRRAAEDWRSVALRGSFATLGNVAAVATAAYDAARTAAAWRGLQQVKVVDDYARLGDYTAEKFAEAFGARSGLIHLPLGRELAESVGRFHASLITDHAKRLFPGGDFSKMFSTTRAVGSAIVDQANPLAEFVGRPFKDSPDATFRLANFDGGFAVWKRAAREISLFGEAVFGLLTAGSTAPSLRDDKTPAGERPPRFAPPSSSEEEKREEWGFHFTGGPGPRTTGPAGPPMSPEEAAALFTPPGPEKFADRVCYLDEHWALHGREMQERIWDEVERDLKVMTHPGRVSEAFARGALDRSGALDMVSLKSNIDAYVDNELLPRGYPLPPEFYSDALKCVYKVARSVTNYVGGQDRVDASASTLSKFVTDSLRAYRFPYSEE